jgi:catechol 2,3-dioxygenase-like lactoylglutathione lyase family enzyme
VPVVHHLNLAVPVGRSGPIAAFYCDVFGLVPIARPDNERAGVWLDADGTQVHLSERDGAPHPDVHVAFMVDDLGDVKAKLREAGADFQAADDVFGTGGRGFTRDPGGNRIELIQRG